MVAIQSDSRSLLELSGIDLTVKEQLQTISDVSSVSIWGETLPHAPMARPHQDGRVWHYSGRCKERDNQ